MPGTGPAHEHLKAFALAVPSFWNTLLSAFCVVSSFPCLGLSSTVTSLEMYSLPTYRYRYNLVICYSLSPMKTWTGFMLLPPMSLLSMPSKYFFVCLHYEWSQASISWERASCKEEPTAPRNTHTNDLTSQKLTFLCLNLVSPSSQLWDKDSSQSSLFGRWRDTRRK